MITIIFQVWTIHALPNDQTCHLYQKDNFTGDPILSLAPSIKVFETNLVFHTSKGITIRSIRLTQSGCVVILCDQKHLKGECSQVRSSQTGKTYENIASVDCHCGDGANDRSESDSKKEDLEEGKNLASLSPSDKVVHVSQNQQIIQAGSRHGSSCAKLFRDWHYQGMASSLQFSGSSGKIELDRVRSISLKNGCKVSLFGMKMNTSDPAYLSSGIRTSKSFSILESTSFLTLEEGIEYACCSCDQCSETVCENAKSEYFIENRKALEKKEESNDFSQFVKYGKKIIGIGRNYRWQKIELAKTFAIPKEPIVFLKPSTSYIVEGQKMELPLSLGTIFYELELGVVIGKKGRFIPEDHALDHVAGYFLALDMTAKQFIKRSGNTSLPWEIGKGFDTACPVGDFIPKSYVPDPNNVDLEAKVNGVITQSDNTKNMIFNVKHLIAFVSRFMTLEPYDVIITGTPDGFGAIKEGDMVEGRMGNITSIQFTAISSI